MGWNSLAKWLLPRHALYTKNETDDLLLRPLERLAQVPLKERQKNQKAQVSDLINTIKMILTI